MDLVLCSGTLPRGVSFVDRLDAAVAGGFAYVSLWGRDYDAARHELGSDDAIRAALADRDLAVAELDPVWWWLPGADSIHIPPEHDREDVFRFGEDDLFAIAEAVNARSINAVDVFGGEWTVDDAARSFAALCDRARDHGLLVHLEFLPWSRIPDLHTAWNIVRAADRDNGGLAIDVWHWHRGNNDIETLRSIPGDRIFGVQLNDGPAQPEPNLVSASLHDRLLPGDGEFDLAPIISTLNEIGCTAPIGVEVFNDDLHALGPIEAAKRAGDAARAVLA